MPGYYFRGEDPSALNLDLTSANRSPGLPQVPATSIPRSGGPWIPNFIKTLQAKAKQALPAAPASAPPVPTVVPATQPFIKLGPLGWALVAGGVYLVFFRRKKD